MRISNGSIGHFAFNLKREARHTPEVIKQPHGRQDRQWRRFCRYEQTHLLRGQPIQRTCIERLSPGGPVALAEPPNKKAGKPAFMGYARLIACYLDEFTMYATAA